MLQGAGALTLLGAALGHRPALAAGPRRLVIWWSGGGWDTSYVFDPHFEADLIDRDPDSGPATYGDLTVAEAEDRPKVRDFFDAWADRAVVVNGLAVGSISHDACARLTLTGRRADAPDLGAMLATGASLGRPLPYVALSGPRFPGALGGTLTHVGALALGTLRGEAPAEAAYDPDREALIREYLRQEIDRVDPDGQRPRLQRHRDALTRLDTLQSYADRLSLPEQPTDDERVALGLTLLQLDLCGALMIEAPLPERSRWDSHQGNDLNQTDCFERGFGALNELVQALHDTPDAEGGTLLDSTLVLAMSEMGRTPLMNQTGGKDHWPTTSLVMIGGGVSGGRTLGATTETLGPALIDLGTGEASASGERLAPPNLLAGVLSAFDVDPEPYFPGVTPFTAWRG
ncbi:DUF1501 domain-containing protein [Myxococcota bacterium]|nr:DUF1501 domain-containing protein [Myxococcota bacterium]